MKLVSLLAIASLIPVSVQGQWKVSTEIDSITDKKEKTAYAYNNEGHQFSIFRAGKDNHAWGLFRLSEKVSDQIAPQDHAAPVIRVDKNKPIYLAALNQGKQSWEMEHYIWSPKWAHFLVWPDNNSGAYSDLLNQLLKGSKITVRYHLAAGGYKDTSFSLTGSSAAISDALGINPQADRAINILSGVFKKNRAEREKQCLATKRKVDCIYSLNKCQKLATLDSALFNQCFDKEMSWLVDRD